MQSVAVASDLPSAAAWSSQFAVAGRAPLERGGDAVHRELTPEYQQVMRVKLVRGRLFTAADRNDAPLVVLINETLAKRYFHGEDPVGLRVAFDKIPDSTSGLAYDRRRGGR